MPLQRVCPVCRRKFQANYAGRVCCSANCRLEKLGTDAARLWARVNFDGPTQPGMSDPCHVWTGDTRGAGYGSIKIGGKKIATHRLAWELANGPIPPGLLALHHCDNPPCVRVTHLFLGTVKDNAQDMLAKGRGNKARGESHGRAKKSEGEIRALLAEYAAGGVTQKELAARYGLHPIYVNKVITGKKWAHLAR